jgi:DnaJ-domain-containing protein 1
VSAQLEAFHAILRSFRNNEVRPSFALILAWIVVCDDPPGQEKITALSNLLREWQLGSIIPTLLTVAKSICSRSIQLASEIVRVGATVDTADVIMNVSVALAAADNYLSISENLILRYLARLLPQSHALPTRYRALTGSDLPPVGDPSSLAWWRERDEPKQRSRTRPNTGHTQTLNNERLRALFVLGLDEKASEEDIRAAYRRLSQVHHPDKFHSLGPDAVKAATETFKRINAAFELLLRK